MKIRQNISLVLLIDKANTYLASDSPHITREMRLAVASILTEALLASGAYEGFQYIGGYHPEKPGFDDSKRQYNTASGLRVKSATATV